MIAAIKAFAKRRWPRLRLRVILFAVLFFAAAMPGISAIFLRVYENTLVRQTEAELVAQGAALSAAAALAWPGARPERPADRDAPGYYAPEPTTIDLRTSQVLPERPAARSTTTAVDPAAITVARAVDPLIERTTRTTLASIQILDSHGLVARGQGVGGDLSGLSEIRAALKRWEAAKARLPQAATPDKPRIDIERTGEEGGRTLFDFAQEKVEDLPDEGLDVAYLVRQLLDVIPNPWQGMRILTPIPASGNNEG